jgi:hypothetical protein
VLLILLTSQSVSQSVVEEEIESQAEPYRSVELPERPNDPMVLNRANHQAGSKNYVPRHVYLSTV